MRNYHCQYHKRLAVVERDAESKSADEYCAAGADKHGGVERHGKCYGNRRVVLEEDIEYFGLRNSSQQQNCRRGDR